MFLTVLSQKHSRFSKKKEKNNFHTPKKLIMADKAAKKHFLGYFLTFSAKISCKEKNNSPKTDSFYTFYHCSCQKTYNGHQFSKENS